MSGSKIEEGSYLRLTVWGGLVFRLEAHRLAFEAHGRLCNRQSVLNF